MPWSPLIKWQLIQLHQSGPHNAWLIIAGGQLCCAHCAPVNLTQTAVRMSNIFCSMIPFVGWNTFGVNALGQSWSHLGLIRHLTIACSQLCVHKYIYSAPNMNLSTDYQMMPSQDWNSFDKNVLTAAGRPRLVYKPRANLTQQAVREGWPK